MKAFFKILFHPILLTILGLIALALVIWFVGPLFSFAGFAPLGSELVRWIIIGIIVLIVVLRAVWRKIKARKNNAQLLDGLMKSSDAPGTPTQSEEVLTLRKRFEEAMRVLKETKAAQNAKKGGLARLLSFGSARYLYELPWYVFIGAPGSGKTTALINSGLRFPLAEKFGAHQLKGIGGTRNCDWWFTDEAVLIDTAGRYTTQDSNQASDHEAWQGFMSLLKRHRPRQPLNGVLLTVSLGDLLSQSESESERHAAALRTRIQELYSSLNVRLPIYVLVTKADLIAGFNEFFNDFGKEARDQVWGVTFTQGGDSAAQVKELSDSLNALRQRVLDLMPTRLREEQDLTRRGAIAAFDQQLAAANRLLAGFLDKVFAPSGFDQPVMVRGAYFTSGTQEGNPIDRVMSSLGGAFGLERRVLPPQTGSGKSFFITRLLREVVFAEQRIGGTNLKWERRRSMLRLAAIVCTVLLTIGLLISWVLSFSNNRDYIGEVNAKVKTTQDVVAQARIAAPDDVVGILPVIDAVRTASHTPHRPDEKAPLSMQFGLFQGDKLDAASDQAYRNLLRDVLLPRIANRVESQLRNLDPNNLEFAYEALKSYLMLHDGQHFDAESLKAWIALDWDQNLPRETTADQRADLSTYLNALFEDGPAVSPIPADAQLISSVRNQLLRYSLPDRIYSRLKRQGVGGEFPAFTIERTVGPAGAIVFTRKSGQPLSRGVPGLFTFDGYHKGFSKVVERVSKQLAEEEPWVLATTSGKHSAEDEKKIANEVRRVYLNDYVRTWDNFINDIGVAKASNLQQSIQIARVLSAPDSPLPKLMRAMSRETTLSLKSADKSAVEKVQDKLSETQSDLSKLFSKDDTTQTSMPAGGIEMIVDDHFAQLRQLVTGDDKTAPITAVVALLNDVYIAMSATETALRDKVAPPSSDASAKVKAESARMPEPVRTMMQDVSAAGAGQALVSLRETLSSAVGTQIGQFCTQAIEGRYPFVRNSTRDVTRDDFTALFGPGGKLDAFFSQNLAQYVDTSTNPWSFKKVQEQSLGNSGNLAQFQRAAVIRDVFFRSGGVLRLEFKPVDMDPSITNFVFDVDGQLIKYSHGPQVPQSVTWPGPKGGLEVRIQMTPPGASGTSGAALDGPWSLFRMLDKANIQPAGAPEKVRVTFAIDGRSTVFDVTSGSVQNPFRLRELAEFRCPTGL
ncbi:MAG: type secretion protein [Rhodocyclales bacterium]|nr:type secretion protein [Rhodocyclales bacterium]